MLRPADRSLVEAECIGYEGPPLEVEEPPLIEEVPFFALGVAIEALAFLIESTRPANPGEDERVARWNWHHAWPKYLGGLQDQYLARLPEKLHTQYHRELNKVAPTWKGTKFFDNLDFATRAEMLRNVARVTRDFDAEHGLHLYEFMLHNGFPVRQ